MFTPEKKLELIFYITLVILYAAIKESYLLIKKELEKISKRKDSEDETKV